MKFLKILSPFVLFLFFTVGNASAQSEANSTQRAAQFEMSAKSAGFTTAYQFAVSTQDPESLAATFESYTGIDVVFYTAKFKDATPGKYCFLINTAGSQYGESHLSNMLQANGFSDIEVSKMKQ